ncbi:MAG: transporter integral rane protein, partial [Solirubrobacterales bacterium]|nr:transporter integral rane protein [Solirubrobacterales bacterium]
MTRWLLTRSVRRAPRRLLVAAVGVAFPVAMLASTLLFVDLAVRSMTRVALQPVQLEMRALATSLNVDPTALGKRLGAVPGVRRVERFAAADVVVGVGAQGGQGRYSARLFAVDPAYVAHHPWVRVTSGSLARGALLNLQLRTASGFGATRRITIDLPGGGPSLGLSLPASGSVDLREATPWFEIPTGEVQGDVAMLPRAVVIDYATFQRVLLPALKARLGTTTPVLNPGLTDLPPVTVEEHITVDHGAYPADPSRAATWSTAVQHVLERQVPGEAVVANDAAETLTLASDDATNAKILFLLLGIPGFLVAAALGLAAESALSEAHRREDALLRLRGATDAQIARLAAAHAA